MHAIKEVQVSDATQEDATEKRGVADIALKIESLSKKYGSKTALSNLNISLNKGEILVLIGPNGAGKSTALNVISGLIKPTSGSIVYLDKFNNPEDQALSHVLGVQLQDENLFNKLTARDYMNFYKGIYSKTISQEKLCEWLGLDEHIDTQISKLSGGWRQRVAIALALINDPEIVILDEPTVGLDPIVRRGLWKVIREIKDSGKAVILSTHYMDEAVSLADNLIMISEGNVVYEGDPDAIVALGKSLEGGIDEAFEVYASNEGGQ